MEPAPAGRRSGHATRAAVLCPDHIDRGSARDGASAVRSAGDKLVEAIGLAAAIDLDIVHSEVIRLVKRRPGTLFGSGVLERLAGLILELEVELVIVDSTLSPVQQRNLERNLHCKVIDRTALILEIFGARARSHEGRLQVELAALTFQRSRLVRSWTHLERQRGGSGFLGGPGESQIELDRRQLDNRIVQLRRELKRVVSTRGLHRAARQRTPHPSIALVGYTNAGKSTLFNRLTGAAVKADDMLFATLDPTMRRLDLPSGRVVILSDTVGFISDLPTDLVAAFRATLEEVREADIILHVRDVSNPDGDLQKAAVEAVLAELGIDDGDGSRQVIEVWNKTDRLDRQECLDLQQCRSAGRVPVSALDGSGCEQLVALLDMLLGREDRTLNYRVAPCDGAAIAWLHRHGQVLSQDMCGESLRVEVVLSDADARRFAGQFGEYCAEGT